MIYRCMPCPNSPIWLIREKIQVYLLMLVFGFTMTKVVSKMICQNMEV